MKDRIPTKLITIPPIIGNMFEWYSFMLYVYFAPVFSELFFPSANEVASLIGVFAVLATGYITRPIGAIICGHIGDRLGRKKVLAVTIIIMAISTTCIGLLPTYAQIGIFAPILLTLCRLFEGLALGGEYAGSFVYLIEHAPVRKRAFYGSLGFLGAAAGSILASSLSAGLASIYTVEELSGWAWRIPFLAGSLAGIVGLYFRLKMPETPLFKEVEKENTIQAIPLVTAFKTSSSELMQGFGITLAVGVSYANAFIFLPTYFTHYLKIPSYVGLTITSINYVLFIFCIIGFAVISDRIGRKKILILAYLLSAACSYILYLMFTEGSASSAFIVQFLFVIIYALMFSAAPATLVELFSTGIRYTSVATLWNLGALIGAFVPILSVLLISKMGSLASPSIIFTIQSVISLLLLWPMKETYQKPIG